MDARLQRRVQRYGWDLAASSYDPLWQAQLASAHAALMACAALRPGERVLDVACGTGLIAFAAAAAVGPAGEVMGVDLSGRMVESAGRQALERNIANARFARMDAERLDLPDAGFDVVLCALGLMYLPDPEQALREMRRVLRPGGRIVLVVWGDRARCGWSALLPIVDAEVRSDVCPLFFRLGQGEVLARLCGEAGFGNVGQRRLAAILAYANADDACEAAFVGGPVALAWSRFDEEVRTRVRAHYLEAIEAWRSGSGYRVPGEFVAVVATADGGRAASRTGANPVKL